jgi:hypothetical protein
LLIFGLRWRVRVDIDLHTQYTKEYFSVGIAAFLERANIYIHIYIHILNVYVLYLSIALDIAVYTTYLRLYIYSALNWI